MMLPQVLAFQHSQLSVPPISFGIIHANQLDSALYSVRYPINPMVEQVDKRDALIVELILWYYRVNGFHNHKHFPAADMVEGRIPGLILSADYKREYVLGGVN